MPANKTASGGKQDSSTKVGGILHSAVPASTYWTAAIAAIGGALFGYDIGVISGAEGLLKKAFHLSSVTEEVAVAGALFGAIIGGISRGKLAERLSRRRALFVLAITYFIGAAATSLSPDLVIFTWLRPAGACGSSSSCSSIWRLIHRASRRSSGS